MICYVNKFSDPDERKCACDRLIIYASVLRQTIVDNDKPVVPPHDVYPVSHDGGV